MLRPWRPHDAAALVRHANDREIWRNVRDRFPHPYTDTDAARWLASVADRSPATDFAIEVDGEAVGGIGLAVGRDVERCAAELGYWLGRALWGRGITTAAVRLVTEYALDVLSLERVFAIPFAWNPASARVLEKAGFELEGVMRRAAIKDGVVVDCLLYARVRE